jgi:hypothetical protein
VYVVSDERNVLEVSSKLTADGAADIWFANDKRVGGSVT